MGKRCKLSFWHDVSNPQYSTSYAHIISDLEDFFVEFDGESPKSNFEQEHVQSNRWPKMAEKKNLYVEDAAGQTSISAEH